MPRVKLQEQLEYEFRHDLTVRVTDINYGGHLGNDSLVGLIHEARVHLMHDLGCNEDDLGDHKIGLIMADLAVNFVREGFLFDKLRIDSHIGEITHSSFRIFHRVVKVGELIALAETGMIAFNYSDRKIALLPRKFLQILDDFLEKN
jgi:acyl-CoA thioesterase FadM